MWSEKIVKKWMALALVIVITIIMAYALKPYVNAFLGSFIMFVLFRPLFNWFRNTLKLSNGVSAVLVILISLFVFLIPLTLLVSIIAEEAQDIGPQVFAWAQSNQILNDLWRLLGDNNQALGSQLAKIGPTAKTFFFGTLAVVSNQLITYTIMYFSFYFLLVTDDEKMKEVVYAIVPFSKRNTVKLAAEFKNITYSTLLTSGLIALVQGSLITIGFLIFHLPGAFMWGFAATLLSFIPFLGVPSIWIPTTLFLLLSGRYMAGVGFLGVGLVASNIDNVIRPIIQKKVGKIHPLQSLLGIFVGFSLFGLIGIVLGPMVISYFILTIQMFKEEYIKNN